MGCGGAHLAAHNDELEKQQTCGGGRAVSSTASGLRAAAVNPDAAPKQAVSTRPPPMVERSSPSGTKEKLPSLPPSPSAKKDALPSLPPPSIAVRNPALSGPESENEAPPNGSPSAVSHVAAGSSSNLRIAAITSVADGAGNGAMAPPEAPQPSPSRKPAEDSIAAVPGAICTTPRGVKPRQEISAAPSIPLRAGGQGAGSNDTVGHALAALETSLEASSDEERREGGCNDAVSKALAALETSNDKGRAREAKGTQKSGKTHVGKAFVALGASGDANLGGTGDAAGGRNVGKAFAALGKDGEDSDEEEGMDIDAAFAMLEAAQTVEDEHAGQQDNCASAHIPQWLWPKDVHVSASSRVLVLTWARWSRNSLRIRAEERYKALQHIRYPKAPRSPPLSPQATPRGDTERSTNRRAAQDTNAGHMSPPKQPAPANTSIKRHPATGSRKRTDEPQGRLLFDVMAEEQRESMEAQGMKVKLQTKFAIEEQHTTDANKTPAFGIDTPGFTHAGSKTQSRMSPMESVVSSGVTSPLAGGQISPWLLEAEALVNDEEPSPASPPLASAWGHSPTTLFDVPETAAGNQITENELNDLIDDEDELDKVVLFNTSGAGFHAPDADAVHLTSFSGTDSLASTATSPAALIGAAGSTRDKQKEKIVGEPAVQPRGMSPSVPAGGHRMRTPNSVRETCTEEAPSDPVAEHLDYIAKHGSASLFVPLPVYTVGESVSYWSASRGVWLPAVIVERKSDHVYLIDKQMKGCLAKVRTSDLISAAEEKRDPVLRAFAALDPEARESSCTPRGKSPRSTASTPRSSRSQPQGERMRTAQSNGKTSCSTKSSARGAASRRETPRKDKQGDPMLLRKVPAILPEVPPALAAAGMSPAVTPGRPRGKIVRDDFSDDSDDD